MLAAVRFRRFSVHAVRFARRFGSCGSVRTSVRFGRFGSQRGSSGSVRIGSQPMRFIQSHGSIRFGSDRFISPVWFGSDQRAGSVCRFGSVRRFGKRTSVDISTY